MVIMLCNVDMKNKQLVIIAGAAGEIGTAYCKELVKRKIDCITIIRNKTLSIESPYIKSIVCNLDNESEIIEKFSSVNFSEYERVTFLHTIGVDKFDPRGYPVIEAMKTIDPDVYNTNVNSFKYLMRYCVQTIRAINAVNKNKIQLKIVIIAGVADKHAPFVIESFCEAKYIVRQYIQSQVRLYSEWVSGLAINITSTITQSALVVRPNADTKYWLQPQEVVDQSIDTLISKEDGYKEIDLIKELPNFIEGYYENNPVLYEKWSKETGIE